MKFFATLLVSFAAWTTLAAEPSDYLVCVGNERSDDITIIDGVSQKALATIPVGKRPRGIQAAPDGRTLFVGLGDSPLTDPRDLTPATLHSNTDANTKPDHSADSIGVVDLVAKKLLRQIPAGADLEQFALSSDGKSIYIANKDAGLIRVLETVNGKVEFKISLAKKPESVAFAPNGKTVYFTCATTGDVFIFDTAQKKNITHFVVAGGARGLVFSPDGSRAYVAAESTNILYVINTKFPRPIGEIVLPTNSHPECLVMSKDGKQLYLSTGWGASICVVDVAAGKLIKSIKVAPRPLGLAISPDGKRLFAANGPANDVSVVDLSTGTEIGIIKVGQSPSSVAIVGPSTGP